MHELSIVESVVDAVTETAARYPGARVKSVKLRVGVLAAVVQESLEFCWELATQGTALSGAALVVKSVPIVLHCAACGSDPEIEGVQSLRCPNCGELTGELRQGRELEIESIEIEEPDSESANQQVSESASQRVSKSASQRVSG
ncbi:MAG: hydrogenase maturation nickel metallochaperone HypA [Terracidiphilus sp.]